MCLVKKFVASLFLSLAVLFFSFSAILGQTPTLAPVEVSEVNSFEVFWPLVAGKTKGESLYFLKRTKEDLRGALIFGAPQKADYNIFLATKRILEAEKLIKESKKELALSTIDEATKNLEKANSNVESAKSSKTSLGNIAPTALSRLNNISALSKWLSVKYPDFGDKLATSSEKALNLASKF